MKLLFTCLMLISFGAISKSTDKDNSKYRPIAHLEISPKECSSPCSVFMDGRKSKAKQGRHLEYFHFYVGNEKIGESRNSQLDTSLTCPQGQNACEIWLGLIVEDDQGEISKRHKKKIIVYPGEGISNEAPVAGFTINPLSPVTREMVTFTSTATDDKEVTRVEWYLSDGRVFFGPTVGLSFYYPGTYIITQVVSDAEGLSSEDIINIVVDEAPAPEDPYYSAMPITLVGVNFEKFNPINLQIDLSTNSSVGFSLNPLEQSISLNGNPLEPEQISVLKNQISFQLQAKEGKNELQFLGADGLGKVIDINYVFYSGSRTISVSVNGSVSGKIIGYLEDESVFKVSQDFQQPTFTLNNVPDLPMVYDVLGVGNTYAYAILEEGALNIDVLIQPNPLPSEIDNNDFLKGLIGWNVEAGTAEVVNRIVAGETLPGNLDLRIFADDSGRIEIRRSFYAREVNKFAIFKFDMSSLQDDDVLHVVLRNENSGELIHQVYSGTENKTGGSNQFDVSSNLSVLAEKAEDIIHVHVSLRKKEQQEELIQFNSLSSFSTSASTQGSSVTINELVFGPSVIDKFYLHSNVSRRRTCRDCTEYVNAYDKDLRFLSVGNVSAELSTYSYNIPYNFKIRSSASGVSIVSKVEIVFEQPSTGAVAVGSWDPIGPFSDIEINNLYNRNDYTKDYVLNALLNVNLKLTQFLNFSSESNDRIRAYLVAYINGERSVFPLGHELTPLKYGTSNLIKVFNSNRDLNVGGDSWGQSWVWDFVLKIFSTPDNFNFGINDLSRLNGGKWSDHSSHQKGVDVDFRFDGYRTLTPTVHKVNPSGIYKTNEFLTKTVVPSFPMREVPLISYVDKVFVTTAYHLFSGVVTSDPISSEIQRERRAGCSADNRPLREIFRHESGHIDHGHIQFKNLRTPPLPGSFLNDFRPYFSQQDALTFEFYVEGSGLLETDEFIWEVRRKDGTIVEVIDEKLKPEDVSTDGGDLISASSNRKYIKYVFPEGNIYDVTVTAVRNFERIERCRSVSFEVKAIESGYYCDGFQTYRGKEEINAFSLHKYLSGAIVSRETIFNAGRFLVDAEEVLICGKSEIRDSYTSFDGCPFDKTKEECASIYIKGIVDAQNTILDATNGKIRIAGQDEQFFDLPLIIPTDPENGMGLDENETSLDDVTIAPGSDSIITLFNADVFGGKIQDSTIIQQSLIYKANISGESTVSGTSVFVFEEDGGGESEVETNTPFINIKGKSLIEGFVYSTANLDIVESTVTKSAVIGGGALVLNSTIEGIINGNASVDDPRVEITDSTLFDGSQIWNAAKILKSSIGALGESDILGTVVMDNALVTNGVKLSGESVVRDSSVLNGEKLLAHEVVVEHNSRLDPTIGGGTREVLFATDSFFFHGSVVTGTPFLSGGFIGGKTIVSGNPTILKSYIAGGLEGSVTISGAPTISGSGVTSAKGHIVVTDNASVFNSGVQDNAKMYDDSMISNESLLAREAILRGSAHVTNKCYLFYGTWYEGTIVPYEGSPCGQTTPLPPLPPLNIASFSAESVLVSQDLSLDSKVSSLENVKIKKPKKLRKKDERVLRGIRRHEEGLEKKLMSLSKAKSKKRKPASLEEVEALHKRSLEYIERVKSEARRRTKR